MFTTLALFLFVGTAFCGPVDKLHAVCNSFKESLWWGISYFNQLLILLPSEPKSQAVQTVTSSPIYIVFGMLLVALFLLFVGVRFEKVCNSIIVFGYTLYVSDSIILFLKDSSASATFNLPESVDIKKLEFVEKTSTYLPVIIALIASLLFILFYWVIKIAIFAFTIYMLYTNLVGEFVEVPKVLDLFTFVLILVGLFVFFKIYSLTYKSIFALLFSFYGSIFIMLYGSYIKNCREEVYAFYEIVFLVNKETPFKFGKPFIVWILLILLGMICQLGI